MKHWPSKTPFLANNSKNLSINSFKFGLKRKGNALNTAIVHSTSFVSSSAVWLTDISLHNMQLTILTSRFYYRSIRFHVRFIQPILWAILANTSKYHCSLNIKICMRSRGTRQQCRISYIDMEIGFVTTLQCAGSVRYMPLGSIFPIVCLQKFGGLGQEFVRMRTAAKRRILQTWRRPQVGL